MVHKSVILTYSFLLLMSIGRKSFSTLGKKKGRSGSTVARLLQPKSETIKIIKNICQSMFQESKKLYVIIDDTLIKKFFSSQIEGTGKFYDMKIGRRINAFKLVVGMISDGKFSIPIFDDYLFDVDVVEKMVIKPKTKIEIAQSFVESALELFPNKKIIVVADGLYSTKEFLQWCLDKEVAAEMRMHSNRVIMYKGKKTSLKNLLMERGICPKGRQMARTITVQWHNMNLEITVVRRIDKHEKESIVFQVATYKALPREHVEAYDCRWPVEKMIRTSKQHIGLQDCYSTSFNIQQNHIAAVFLAYALAQQDVKRLKLKNPEEAIRRFKMKNERYFEQQFFRFLNTEPVTYA